MKVKIKQTRGSIYRKLGFLFFMVCSLLILVLLLGCAAHPTVAYKTLEKGESYYGYSLSLENVFPVMFYRYGITEKSDIGLRLGVPIYGSGIDYSRVLYEKEGKRDVLNLAWALSPNSNFDFTYYKFSEKKKRPNKVSFWGLRGMIIPKGINGGQSIRLGFLFGSHRKGRFGYEIGYFHDFASMPITQLFSTKFDWADTSKWDNRFLDYPHASDWGFPTEYSRLTGISVRITFELGRKEEVKKPSSSEDQIEPTSQEINKEEE